MPESEDVAIRASELTEMRSKSAIFIGRRTEPNRIPLKGRLEVEGGKCQV